MPTNRLASYLADSRPARFSFEIARRRQTPVHSQAFVACPMALLPVGNGAQLAWQQQVYQLALHQAQESIAARKRALAAAFRWN